MVGMKLFLFDVDYIDVEDHAIRRSVYTAFLWLLLYPAGVGCVALVGSGIALLVRCMGMSNMGRPNDNVNDQFAQWLTCMAMAAFLLISSVQRFLHYVPYTRMLMETHHQAQARTLLAVHYFQIATQCVFAIVVYSMQFWNVSSFQILIFLVGIVILLVAVNLIDELVLLNDAHIHNACADAKRTKNKKTMDRAHR
uniref:Uncharacterized protein n=1 Tax=Lotharella oceanica TaxID=641309 RepID=A0A7S2TNL7_9EUKA